MPKRGPEYALHKPSGQARVRIDGKTITSGSTIPPSPMSDTNSLWRDGLAAL